MRKINGEMISNLIENEKNDMKIVNNVLRDNNEFVKEKPHANILILSGTQSNQNGNTFLDLFQSLPPNEKDAVKFKADC